jgi:hypothetical protein
MKWVALALLAAWVEPKELATVTARKNFWSFQRPVRPSLPAGAKNPIDAFVREQLARKNETPKQELNRAALLRRLSLDLTGLPPTPAEVKAFVQDRSPDAYEKQVGRLMQSPHYGERWAQQWLDVVRYADTNGYELDAERIHAWRYRDYVIRSFNTNKRFDRFLKEQIAGDELFPGDRDALIALGFLRAGPQHVVGGNQDEEMNRQEQLSEMTAAVGGAFLGLTMNCAKCHNHKFDPILQADYYRLQAIFAPAADSELNIAQPFEELAYQLALAEYEARLMPVLRAIDAIEKPYREQLRAEKRAELEPKFRDALNKAAGDRSEEEKRLAKEAQSQISPSWDEVLARLPALETERRRALRKQLHQIELDEPAPPARAYAVANLAEPAPTHILKVGDHKMKLGRVEPGTPLVLALARGVDDRGELPGAAVGRRAALANWLASPDHPLTARVFVNRIWQFRMGEGIVTTPNDFGALGARPSDPKLLDWLAVEFMDRGWDIRAIDRLIVTSEAYRRERPRRRLDAEQLRDSILAVTGELNREMYGPPVRTPIEPEVYDLIFTEYEADNLWPLPKDPRQMLKRTIYLLNKRTVRLPMLANFDQPDTMTSCPKRATSTHALQSLTMLNSDFMRDRSAALAASLDRKDPVGDAYSRLLARAPSGEERAEADQFLRDGGNLAEFSLAMLNRNDFVYLP